MLGGWVASYPPPKAPQLPSVFQSHQSHRNRFFKVTPEYQPAKRPPVWLDTHTGVYYFLGSPEYGRTPGGKYLTINEAKAQGYRSSAKM